MKYSTLFILFCFFLTIPYQAHADPEDPFRFYIGAKLGYHGLIPSSIHDDSYTLAQQPSIMKLDAGVLSVFTLGVAIGIHVPITSRLRSRTELEYMYKFEGKTKPLNDGTQQFSKLKLSTHTILANTYIDYDVIKFVSLYLGVGIGTSVLEVDISKERTIGKYRASKIIPNFAWQIGIGTRIELTEYIFLDANFRYINLGGIKAFGDVTTVRMSNADNNGIEILFSASYVF